MSTLMEFLMLWTRELDPNCSCDSDYSSKRVVEIEEKKIKRKRGQKRTRGKRNGLEEIKRFDFNFEQNGRKEMLMKKILQRS